MGAKEFDYYIFIDYSEHLIGYIILEEENINDCLSKVPRFRHYRKSKKRRLYLKNAKKTFNKKELLSCFTKTKIRNVMETPEIFTDVAKFLKDKKGSQIFISVDDRQYRNFERFVEIIDGKNIRVVKESKLKENSSVYRINLVLDTWLNIERIKDDK